MTPGGDCRPNVSPTERQEMDEMTVELQQRQNGKVLVVPVSGKLERADYDRFVPEFERLIQQHGKIRVLLETHDFHGWTAGALWDDIKLNVKHFNDIERVAVVGEKKWEKGMTTFCKPFTTATIRFFDHDHADEAYAWIEEE
jgi:hypothetical protein